MYKTPNSLHNLQVTPTKLGSGAASTVYRGVLEGMEVAVKEHQYNNIYEVERDILKKLHHPNIIQLIGYIRDTDPNTHEQYARLVMEIADHGDLADFLESHQFEARDPGVCLGFARDIAQGLVYLHSLNIIHMDVKPQNVLLFKNMHAKLIDFSMSFQLNPGKESLRTQAVLGSYQWSAPEMHNFDTPYNHLYRKKYDLYPLGWILYLMLSDKETHPPGRNNQEIQYNHRNSVLPRLPTNIPQKTSLLITQCWKTNAQERPTASEACEILESDDNLLRRLSCQ